MIGSSATLHSTRRGSATTSVPPKYPWSTMPTLNSGTVSGPEPVAGGRTTSSRGQRRVVRGRVGAATGYDAVAAAEAAVAVVAAVAGESGAATTMHARSVAGSRHSRPSLQVYVARQREKKSSRRARTSRERGLLSKREIPTVEVEITKQASAFLKFRPLFSFFLRASQVVVGWRATTMAEYQVKMRSQIPSSRRCGKAEPSQTRFEAEPALRA